MSGRRPLRLSTALDALPKSGDLRALRALLFESSRPDPDRAAARPYDTVEARTTDAGAVEAGIAALADAVRDRTEGVLRQSVAALRALEAGDEAAAATALVRAGEIEEAADRLADAEAFYRSALAVARRPRDRRPEGLALCRLGRVARGQGRLGEALGLYRRGHGIAVDAGDEEGVVTACLGVGHVLSDEGRWVEAREWYLRGLERLGDAVTPRGAHLCNSLSVVARRMGALEESEEWLDRGDESAAAAGDPVAAAHLEHSRARWYMARGAPESAEAALRALLGRDLEPRARASTLINLAEVLAEQGKWNDAVEAVRAAEELSISTGAVLHLPHVYRLLGDLAGKRGDRDGFVFFEQALDLIEERALPPVEYATTQWQYGRFEARFGDVISGAARLRLARETFLAIPAEFDARAVGAELAAIEAGTTIMDGEDV